ncbi:uncharacterized protein LOC134249283 [Saccostrea cucullata]|uniref:uncharacterized protein LOC134249283 n=1 Tax=Saccostrea cuccullata TaxID=36930 RepID=UPI002ED4E065
MVSWFHLLLIIWILQQKAEGSHFRGGILMWKPTNNENEVIITFRMAWRRTYNSRTRCDRTTVEDGGIIANLGNVVCYNCSPTTISDVGIVCTDFSLLEDWMQGERSFTYTFQKKSAEIGFEGGDWISLVSGGGSWQMRTTVDLNRRRDTGKINSSPVSAMPPIIRLQQGCEHNITIPVYDKDNDTVRCRWAESSKSECAGVCRSFPNSFLDEKRCEISYIAKYRTGWYAVAIQIEDFSPLNSTHALSSVSLQFLVNVFSSDKPCQDKPKFIMPTRLDGACVGIPINSTWTEQIIARSGADGVNITEITTVSPPGLTTSTLQKYAMSGREWYVNVTWTPTPSQAGEKTFCYTASDSDSLVSEKTCVKLFVGVEPPQIISYQPVGEILPTQKYFTISFDLQVVQPLQRAFIYFYTKNGNLVSKIDVSQSDLAVYSLDSTGSGNWILRISIDFNLKEKEHYYIKLDPGIAKGVSGCGAESAALWDPNNWTFRVRDVTPPVLTFCACNPTVTGGNITVKWDFDEPVLYVNCTLQNETHFSNIKCNETSWTSEDFKEGFYTLFVQGTDFENNTANLKPFTWFVDKTGPILTMTKTPSTLSNQNTAVFEMNCNERCRISCSLTPKNSLSSFTQCSAQLRTHHSITKPNLVSGTEYKFEVMGIDESGNRGKTLFYEFETDFELPYIEQLSDLSVECQNALTLNITGKPNATDNIGIKNLTYTDLMLDNCKVRRSWTAYDLAGNKYVMAQIISIISSSGPVVVLPLDVVIACGSLVQITEDVLKPSVQVYHPCGLEVSIVFKDPSEIGNGCGFTFVRNWTVSDNCGKTIVGFQTITVMDPQDPITPKRGEITDLRPLLSWPEGLKSARYRLFVWNARTNRPKMYNYFGPNTWFQCVDLRQGEKYYWQVEYVTNDNTTQYSPRWNFVTKSYIDLSIIEITIPPVAHSGQSFEVRWIVQNIGKAATSYDEYWYDRVYFGFTEDISSARRVASIIHRKIIAENDTYQGITEVRLLDDDIGTAFIFVSVDTFRYLEDYDRSNNFVRSRKTVNVQLTPPPDLIIDKIDIPSSTFSGQNIQLQYVVKNVGKGSTKSGSWIDSVYWSKDAIYDGSDIYMLSTTRNEVLLAGSSYLTEKLLKIPQNIYGVFYILIRTDANDNVFEHTDEDNNLLASKPLDVTLSPPPDLSVVSLKIVNFKSTFVTGEIAQIEWIVRNEGSRQPDVSTWIDAIVLETNSKWRMILEETYIHHKVKPYQQYTESIFYVINPYIDSGRYNLCAITDESERVFEYQSRDNNKQCIHFNVSQLLPDLRVEEMSLGLHVDEFGYNVLNVSWTVLNTGSGPTLTNTWTDGIAIQNQNSNSLKYTFDVPIQLTSLNPSQKYSQKASLKLGERIYGQISAVLYTDKFGQIYEHDENNNQDNREIVIPLKVPNLKIIAFQILNETVYSGEKMFVRWTVLITNIAISDKLFWTDILKIKFEPNDFMIDSFVRKMKGPLLLGDSYSWTVEVQTPQNFIGFGHLNLVINNNRGVFEGTNLFDNSKILSVKVLSPPSPDLVVTDINCYLVPKQSRLIVVIWTVKNTGNGMKEKRDWNDDISVQAAGGSVSKISIASQRQSWQLESGAEYLVNKTFIVPSSLVGRFHVNVTTDSNNVIQEVNAESNNWKLSDSSISFPELPKVDLKATVTSSGACQLNDIESFCISYTVVNEGDIASKTSWNDAIFICNSYVEGNQKLEKLALVNHIGKLSPGESYFVNTSVVLPFDISDDENFIIVLPDYMDNYQSSNRLQTIDCSATEGHFPIKDLLEYQMRTFCANLQVDMDSKAFSFTAGELINVEYNISNSGFCDVKSGFYVAIYLSSSIENDLFEWKINTTKISDFINKNGTRSVSSFIQLPFDMESKDYFLVVQVDSRHELIELNENDNIAISVLKVKQNIRTDIVVFNVSAPEETEYGEMLTVQWSIMNNGSQHASGYKCDSVYLSQDSQWSVTDELLGKMQCGRTSIRNRTFGGIVETYSAKLPPLASENYKTIVKSRTNFEDFNQTNNIGVSINRTFIRFPICNLGQNKSFSISPNQLKIFVIPSVPAAQTMLIRTECNVSFVFHEVYVKYESAPSEYDFDFSVEDPFKSRQEIVVTNTRGGNYYILMKTSGSRNVNSPVFLSFLPKLAKFEVINIFPNTATAHGNITLKISGTLLPENFSACLFNSSFSVQTNKKYWYSSSLVAATFDATHLNKDSTYSLNLTDHDTQKVSSIQNALFIMNGRDGYITVKISMPETLFLGQKDTMHVDIKNSGDSDIYSPLVHIKAIGGQLKYIHDFENGDWTSGRTIVSGSSDGPAGILLPSEASRLQFEIRSATPDVPNEMKVVVSRMGFSNEKHSYMNMKFTMKPTFLEDAVWDDIWQNFIGLVGESWFSLRDKITEVMNEISVLGHRQYSLENVVKYLLYISEGLCEEKYMVKASDFGKTSQYGVKLDVVRLYPRRFGLRRGKGPVGIGWLMPYWETYLVGLDESLAVLNWKREEIVFEAYGIGTYSNAEWGNLTLSFQDTLLFLDTESNDVYHFNFTTGKIEYVIHENEKIEFAYDTNDRLSALHSEYMDVDVIYNENNNIAEMSKRNNLTSEYEKCSYGYSEGGFLSSVYCGNEYLSYEYNENGDLVTINEGRGMRRAFQYTPNHHLRSDENFINDYLVSKKIYQDFQNGRLDIMHVPQNTKESYWVSHEGKIIGHKKNRHPIVKNVRKQNVQETIEGDLVVNRIITSGEITEVQDANSDSIGYLDNDYGYRVIYVDGNLNPYYLFRSLNNSIHTIIYPDNSNETYLDLGDAVVHKDQRGIESTYYYDKLQRLTLRESGDHYVQFKYTDNDRIQSIKDSQSQINFMYDEFGRQKGFTKKVNDTVFQTVDDSNRLRNLRIESDPYDIAYNYNLYGNIKYVKDNTNGKIIVKVDYNENGLIKTKILGNNATTHYEYDEKTRLPKVISNFHPNGTASSEFRYTYDMRGRLSSMQTFDGTWSFAYDLSGQLISMKNPRNETTLLQYDQGKNRVYVIQNDISKLYQVNSLNQYVSIDGEQYSYDENGNMVRKSNLLMEYDLDNRLSRFVSENATCQIQYDSLGHIRRKRCNNSDVIYLTDVSGRILKQLEESQGVPKYHIYADGIGLIATKENNEYSYYQYDGFGSVVNILGKEGEAVDSFIYEPFGAVLTSSKGTQGHFRYLGQWGMLTFVEMPSIYFLGSRPYDSKSGRFFTKDREGIFCQQPNLYMFKGNNPLNMDLVLNYNENQRCTLKDLDVETTVDHSYRKAVSRLYDGNHAYLLKIRRRKRSVTEPQKTNQNQNPTSSKIQKPRRKRFNEGNGINNFIDEFKENNKYYQGLSDCGKHLVDKGINKVVDWVKTGLKASPLGRVAMGIIDVGGFLYKHRKCILSPCDCLDNAIQKYHDTKKKIESLLNDASARQDAINKFCDRWNPPCRLIDSPPAFLCKAAGTVINSQFHRFQGGLQRMYDKVKPYTEKLDRAADFASKACDDPSEIGDALTRWIGSFDPNDILGPAGYGAARFITSKAEMVYKIRFENMENATAPAQRVFIEIIFHDKLNARTFRLGGFGFGEFVKELSFKQSFIQETVNLTEEYGVFVQMRGGLDIINNKVTWEFQAINGSTGLPPSDPSVGFLPPNNGTTGQGFVTFSIRPSSDVKSLDKITAKAVIIFDQNEPIDTPEIFNTIDDDPPHVSNVSVNKEAMVYGSLILNLDVIDNESGLDFIDILYADSESVLLVSGVRENAVSLPVDPGKNHTIIIYPVDKIGNSESLQTISSDNIYTLFYPQPEVRCDDLNNCSGNGRCEALNFCSCFDGFYGRNCAETTPPLDPPLLDVFSGDQGNSTLPMYLSSKLITNVKNADISIQCKGFPDQSLFSVGTIKGDTLHLGPTDFGDVLYMPPAGYVGNFSLQISSFVSVVDSSEISKRETIIHVTVKHSVTNIDRQKFKETHFGPTITDIAPLMTASVTTSVTSLITTIILMCG